MGDKRLAQTVLGVLACSAMIISFYYLASWTRVSLSTPSYAILPLESLVPPEVLEWMILCTSSSAKVLILHEDILRVLAPTIRAVNKSSALTRAIYKPDEGLTPANDILSVVNFGILDKDTHKHLKALVQETKNAGWEHVQQEKSNRKQFVFTKNDVILRLSVIEQKHDHWYISESKVPRAPPDPPRGFLGLSVGKLKWPVTNGVFVNGSLYFPSPVDFYLWQVTKSKYLECNYASSRRLQRLRLRYPERKPNLGPEFGHELAYVRDILVANGAVPMLAGETALGWYRECGFAPDAHSAHLAFPSSQWSPSLEAALNPDRMIKLLSVSGQQHNGLIVVIKTKSAKVYLSAVYEESNSTWTRRQADDGVSSKHTYPALGEICTCSLHERLFYVRCDIIAQLESDYGKKWYDLQSEPKDTNHHVDRS